MPRMKKMPKNVLFLDIDGVLNGKPLGSWPSDGEMGEAKRQGFTESFLKRMLDPECLEILSAALASVEGVEIVVHSTWRKMVEEEVLRPLLSVALRVPAERIHMAPYKFSSDRSHEISMWVEQNDPKVKNLYLVLDDRAIHMPEDLSRMERSLRRFFSALKKRMKFVKTDETKGLTKAEADVIEEYFGRKNGIESKNLVR